MSQPRKSGLWPWKHGVVATLLHACAGIAYLAISASNGADGLRAGLLLVGPFTILCLGLWAASRGVFSPQMWSRWWRAQVAYVVLLALNVALASVWASLGNDEDAQVAGMSWIAPAMWPFLAWPLAPIAHWVWSSMRS